MYKEAFLKPAYDKGYEDVSMETELERSLSLLSLSPTIDRTSRPRTLEEKRLALCILGSPKQHLDLLLEGAECCPGDMILVFSPSWLEKASVTHADNSQESEEDGSSSRLSDSRHLFVHKAVTFDKGGSTYLDVFKPPRRVTYFINDMPEAFDSTDVDCAKNGSTPVAEVQEDYLLWKVEMWKIGAFLPPCLLLCYRPSCDLHEKLKEVKGAKVIELSTILGPTLTENVKDFLSGNWVNGGKVIITTRINGQMDSSCWSTLDGEITDLVSHIHDDIKKMTNDDYICVEVVGMLQIHQRGSLKWKTKSGELTSTKKFFDVTAGITVCRGLDDQVLLAKISASATLSTNPASNRNYFTLETTLGDFGITDESQVNDLRQEIRRQARAVMNKVAELEKCYNGLYIGPRTDFLDIEFYLGMVKGTVTPLLQVVTNQYRNLDGGESENWVRTANVTARMIIHVMVMRSHSLLLKDKWILVLSIRHKGREDFWTNARKYGVKILLVTSTVYEDTEQLVDMLISIDLHDRKQDDRNIRNILTLVKERNLHISGCIAMNDPLTMMAAMIRKRIGAKGPALEASHAANEKNLTYSKLGNTPSRRFVKEALQVSNMVEMKRACKEISFPAFVKFAAGGGAIGSAMVNDEEECLKHYKSLLDEIQENRDVFELDTKKNSVILTEFIDGTEHITELVMFDGKLIAAFIRDVAPPNYPTFTCTGQSMPSKLAIDKINSLVRASHQICLDIGLRDGAFNVEMRFTPEGPKLLEVNGRLGGHAILPMIKQCFDEDLIMLDHLINCGIRPTVVRVPSLGHAYHVLLSVSEHYRHLSSTQTSGWLAELCFSGKIFYREIRDIKMTSYNKVIASIGVIDEDGKKAKQTLLTICQIFGLDTPTFPCSYFLEHL